jgi:hypothetical protein
MRVFSSQNKIKHGLWFRNLHLLIAVFEKLPIPVTNLKKNHSAFVGFLICDLISECTENIMWNLSIPVSTFEKAYPENTAFWNVTLRSLYLSEISVETTRYPVSGHCTRCPANTGVTRGFGLPQRGWCRLQSCGMWLRVDRLEATHLSEKLTALFRYISSADVQGIHKRMVRFQKNSLLIPHHSFVYALYLYWLAASTYTQQCYAGSLSWTVQYRTYVATYHNSSSYSPQKK